MALHVRVLGDAGRTKIELLTPSRTAPVRRAARAWIVQLSAAGETVPAIAARLSRGADTVRTWIKRVSADGRAGLAAAPRSGRPRTYDEDVRGRAIATARPVPPQPAEGAVAPTGHGTSDRLRAELARDGLPIRRSQIRRIRKAEHPKWQKPRAWRESDAPHVAAKRGRSSRSPPTRPTVAA